MGTAIHMAKFYFPCFKKAIDGWPAVVYVDVNLRTYSEGSIGLALTLELGHSFVPIFLVLFYVVEFTYFN